MLFTILLQLVLIIGALVLSVWARLPWVSLGGLALVGASALTVQFGARREWFWHWDVVLAGAGTVAAIGGVLHARAYSLDLYHAALAWLVAAAILLAARRTAGSGPVRPWKILGALWVFFGSGLWLILAYLDNQSLSFHLAVLLNLVLLVLFRLSFELRPFGIRTVNTLVLMLLALPIADLFFRPSYRTANYLEPARKYYSFAKTKGDPAMFGRWCRCFQLQWDMMAGRVFMPDPAGRIPVRLRPGSEGRLFDSRIAINQLGFRGKELAAEKGAAYRIVALGESTTFGCTLNPDDKPWPELLEEMIAQRLHPPRPVQVINAGVPANHIEHCLLRLPSEILPLQPDLLISYHGFNGFSLLSKSTPTFVHQLPPAYYQRPLKLLADCEYRLRVRIYRRRMLAQRQANPPGLVQPLQTQYAQDYRHLIEFARTNRIRLALANFSMALDAQSSPELVAFYRAGYPSAYWQTHANVVHSKIVEQLSGEHPEVCLVDTHPALDGQHEKFIDLVHLTQAGRAQLAENIFTAIRPLLEADLAQRQPWQP